MAICMGVAEISHNNPSPSSRISCELGNSLRPSLCLSSATFPVLTLDDRYGELLDHVDHRMLPFYYQERAKVGWSDKPTA